MLWVRQTSAQNQYFRVSCSSRAGRAHELVARKPVFPAHIDGAEESWYGPRASGVWYRRFAACQAVRVVTGTAGVGRGNYFGPLSKMLDLPADATRAQLLDAMRDSIVGEAAHVGRFRQ